MRSSRLLPFLIWVRTIYAFSLNTTGRSWDYTTASLANTTSSTCKSAYSTDIACISTLLGLVTDVGPAFESTVSGFDALCVDSCKVSLDGWMSGVEGACTAEGDKAQENPGGSNWWEYILDPVDTVGEIFEYVFAEWCTKKSNGAYCHLFLAADADSFSCDDECAISYYTKAHTYPGALKEFYNGYLVEQGDWRLGDYQTGWERVVSCGKGVDSNSSSSTGSGTATTTTKAAGASATINTGVVIRPVVGYLVGGLSLLYAGILA